MADTRSGTQLIAGRYRLRTLIGRGGSAAVWHAEDRELRRPVAVKHIVLGASGSTRSRTRAMREAQVVATLRTPGVVQLYDVHEESDQVYLIMELIRAPSLSRLVRRHGPVTADRAAWIGRSMLRTLVAVHNAGIVHRDVKPSNVLVTDTAVHLTDFGIALLADDATLTASGSVLGTPAYMAPEQARGQRVGPGADLYGLGATLYFALEGCAPFADTGSIETTRAVRDQPPRPGRQLGPLRPLIEALLVKEPCARPDVVSIAAALDDIAAPLCPSTVEATPSSSTVDAADDPSALSVPAAASVPKLAPDPDPPFVGPPYADEEGRQIRRTLLLAGLALLVLAVALLLLFIAVRDHPDAPATAVALLVVWPTRHGGSPV